jgi:hypothetical protein
MSAGGKTEFVTRSELYSHLGNVWLFITFALGFVAQQAQQTETVTGLIAVYTIFSAALCVFLFYGVCRFIEQMKRKEGA